MSQNDKKLNKLIVELSSIYANVSLLGITLAYLSSFVFDGKNISYKTVILLIPILIKPIHKVIQVELNKSEGTAYLITGCLALLLPICFLAAPLYTLTK
jgi:hypothetical protein